MNIEDSTNIFLGLVVLITLLLLVIALGTVVYTRVECVLV